MASSVAHDSHNVIAVGVDDADIVAAVNLVMEAGGGLSAACAAERVAEVLPLPVAGLMATGTCEEVGHAYGKLDKLVKAWGSPLRAPYMTLSFMALLVIPALKLSDRGLFDGAKFEFTRPVAIVAIRLDPGDNRPAPEYNYSGNSGGSYTALAFLQRIRTGVSIMATITETVRRPQVRQTQCFIGGKWVPSASGKTFETIHPATEEVICEVAEGDKEDVDAAVDAAREAFDNGPWSKMDARDRGQLMYKLADLIEEEADELAALETLDNGKPISDSRAADIPLVIDCLRYYAGWADKIQGTTIPVRGDYFCYTRREPVGVVGQIIPWNFPVLMVAWKWGPALAAGCTIVMKPAEQTPLTCLRMARLAQKAGIPGRRHQRRARLRPDGRRGASSSIRASTRSRSPAKARRRRSFSAKRPRR